MYSESVFGLIALGKPEALVHTCFLLPREEKGIIFAITGKGRINGKLESAGSIDQCRKMKRKIK